MSAAVLCTLLSALAAPAAGGVAHLVPAAITRPDLGAGNRPGRGRFLIASRKLGDPHFAEAVVLLLAADAHGAAGVIINRETPVPLASALPDVKELHGRADHVFVGGPVGEGRMLLLIRSKSAPQSSQRILTGVYASGSLAALRAALKAKQRTQRVRAYAGYAGWGPGQLEAEIAHGDWYVAPGDPATVFDARPADVWTRLVARFSGQWIKAPRDTPPGGAGVRCAAGGDLQRM